MDKMFSKKHVLIVKSHTLFTITHIMIGIGLVECTVEVLSMKEPHKLVL
jgi:hypothetical protein